jgi:L-ascorbate metabolism protein UlaG (beta-lactamase superfamily)
MDMVWLGHSSFRLHSQGMVVVTDPFPESLGLRMDGRTADIVTVSNTHPNHSADSAVDGEPKVFSAPGEYEFNHVMVRGVMTPLVDGAPHAQRNVAYTIEMDGVSVCHLGDLTRPLTTRQVEELKPVDVALVPAGGHCTLSLDQALQTLQDLDPKVVVPMHYGHGQEGVTLDGVEPFLRRMGLEDETQPQARLVVTPGNLPSDLRINLMVPRPST